MNIVQPPFNSIIQGNS